MIVKANRRFLEDDSGVENAIYSILMIAIVVIVALMLGSLVLSRGGQLEMLAGTPRASLSGVLVGGGSPSLMINHESGDPINVSRLSLSTFDENGVLIGITKVISSDVKPSELSPGMQSSAIPLTVSAGNKIMPGNKYTIKVTDSQSKQQIGMMELVAR
jgi:archaeal type IV pilus assembly protein PilA